MTDTATSSSTPAARHCAATLAPRMLTYLSPAAAPDSAIAVAMSRTNDALDRVGGRVVRQHELRALPAAAENLALAFLAL
jgi:hypothetical protein